MKCFFSFLIVVALLSMVPCYGATGSIDATVRHQEIEGFGAAAAWYEEWITAHPEKGELYEVLFQELGSDIYRTRNVYDQPGYTDYMSRTAEIIAGGEAALGHPLKVLISSWSPPAYLKSNNDLVGGTLIGSPNYDYAGFALWWADSIDAWSLAGVNADYISMQNEPDYTASWDSCRFDPTEGSVAGYDQAFEAVYNEIYSRFGANMPKMLAPETTGFNGASGGSLDAYLSALINHSHVYGYAHHLYNIDAGDNPDNFLSAMSTFNANWGTKPLMQTEYEKSTNNWPDALNLAHLLHNSLTVEEVSMYLYWDYVGDNAGYALVSLDSPWEPAPGYTINNAYYGMKHYAAFTDAGWERVDATSDTGDLKISAYISPDDKELSAVLVNTGSSDLSTSLSFSGFTPASGGVFQTTQTQDCVYAGTYSSSFTVPAQSIMTLQLLSSSPDSTAPAAPSNLMGISDSDLVELNWDGNSESDLAGYNIYRSTTSGGPYTKLNSEITDRSEYDDTDVVNGTTYFYVVTAVDIHLNESNYSDEAAVTPRPYENILVNPGFEEGTTGWSGRGCSFDVVSSEANSGSYSGRAFDRTQSWQGLKQSVLSTMRNGKTYTFSGWVLTNIPSGTTVYMSVEKQDGSGTSYHNVASATARKKWVYLEGEYTLNATGTLNVLDIYFETASGTDDFHVDDASVFGPPPPGDTTPPAAPTGLVATAVSSTRVDLDWDDNTEPDLAGYKIYRSETAGGPYSLVDSGISTSDYSDTSAVPSTTYYYVVKAVDTSYNESDYSNEDSATTPGDTTPPAAPTNLSASAGDSTVSLDWDDNTEGDLDSYNVYRSTTQGSGYTSIATGVANSDYIDNTVTNGTTYYYVVTAVDTSSNESAYSNEASTTPEGDVTPPAAPTNLAATAGNNSVSLNWDDNSEPDLDSYNVYRDTTAGGPYTQIASGVATSDFVDNTVTNGTTYYYVVTAVDTSTNESSNSNEASVTPQAGGTMHVDVINLWTTGGGSKVGVAQVYIVDSAGAPVANATVTGIFTGSYNETRSGITDGNGEVQIQTADTASGKISFTFCVDDVTHASLVYDPGANVETCETK